MTEETTNPETEVEPIDAPEVEAEEPDTDETSEGEEPEEEDDDSEDVDYEGKLYRVPKHIKDALMRQADYTRKTQEVAEQRRMIEQAQAAFEQRTAAQQAMIKDYAKVEALTDTLAEYEKVDWRGYSATDPGAAQQAWIQFQQLRDQKAQLVGQLQNREREQAFEAQRATARQIEEGQAILARDIKGWGPELAAKVSAYAMSEVGVTQEELSKIADPRVVKLLYRAYEASQSQKATQTAKKAVQAVAIKPVKAIGSKAAAPSVGLSDQLPTDEWLKRRREQIAKRK